jgi:hypothetical protein
MLPMTCVPMVDNAHILRPSSSTVTTSAENVENEGEEAMDRININHGLYHAAFDRAACRHRRLSRARCEGGRVGRVMGDVPTDVARRGPAEMGTMT